MAMMLMRKRKALAILLLVAACSDEPVPQNSSALDAGEFFDYSDNDLKILINDARKGDLESARRLYAYYSTHGQAGNATVWEEWLFDRGDRSTIMARSERLFSHATVLADKDPTKLDLLRRAVMLDKLAKSTPANKSEVTFGEQQLSEREFTEKVRGEMERVSAIQGAR